MTNDQIPKTNGRDGRFSLPLEIGNLPIGHSSWTA